MTLDNSRFTFNHLKDYHGPVMQQGRVQLDSDWNEWLAEVIRRTQAGTLDTLGRAVYPATTPFAFHITPSRTAAGANVLKIGPGRLYVDGLLAENHGDANTLQWDPALAELSNASQPPPQPPPPPGVETGAIEFTAQPPYTPPSTTVPPGDGPFLAYLDVWIRPVDYLNDPDLVDKAVGVDSTGRLQTVWRVRLLDLSNGQAAITCDSPIPNFPPAPSAGRLTTDTTPTAPSGPCCLTSGSAYTGQENQFYRVQIHHAAPAGATFKWSRDNGSVVTGVTAINAGNPGSQLTVLSLGRDQVLGFAPGNWIEVVDDSFEFDQSATYSPTGKSGELHQIDTVDFASKTITLATQLGTSFATGATDSARHTRIRRWDQSGKVYEKDGTTVWWDIDVQGADIPVPPSGTSLILENGITVSFDVPPAGGQFNAGDFWTFAARTADGSVEKLTNAPPRGIHHHYARLAIVTFPGPAQDCRTPWPPSTGDAECGCCCTVTVGDGATSVGKFTSINDAIGHLKRGGEVCVLPGRYFEHVVIEGRRDIVIRGCGWQTRIASPSLKAASAPAVGTAPDGTPAASVSAGSSFDAVITIARSEHVQLLSFAVEAAPEEVGILIDGTGALGSSPTPRVAEVAATPVALPQRYGTIDVTLKDLVVTASTRPSILAYSVELLQIESNRVAMEDVRGGQWPAVWVSGKEIRVVHNWVGIQSSTANREWLPATVKQDLAPGAGPGSSPPLHPGGIQIGGASVDVFVLENEIDGAGYNGITLGSLTVVDTEGRPTRPVTGVTIERPGPCETTITLTRPGRTTGDQDGGRIVVAGKLANIQINRNRIRNTGLCGIGPVVFFNLVEVLEIISIENLTIAANTITSTLLSELDQPSEPQSTFGYGAICVPDVENLVIRDNNVTDFGREPGDPACGIFVLHGETVEISRNHVLETRDWTPTQNVPPAGGIRGGIVLMAVTPPTFNAVNPYGVAEVSASKRPVFLPNLPALRVEHNTVRVALGNALAATGFGPFSIVNNHLATGGTIKSKRESPSLAETVLLLNLSLSIESQTLAGGFSQLGNGQLTFDSSLALEGGIPACGAVIFTNNTCQLEARLSGQRAFASVMIFALDDLIFGHNECWLDGRKATASVDALLAAGSLQATSNRFQEAAGFPVLASAFTLGALNITSQNISSYCLFATGTLQSAIDQNNLSLFVPSDDCRRVAGDMNLKFTT